VFLYAGFFFMSLSTWFRLIDGRNEHPWMVATLPRLQHLEEIEREAMQQFQQHLQQTIGDQGKAPSGTLHTLYTHLTPLFFRATGGEQNTPQPQNILNEPGKVNFPCGNFALGFTHSFATRGQFFWTRRLCTL